MTRECRDCQKVKPLSEFGKRSAPRTGFLSYCRACLRIRWRRWAGYIA